MYIIRIRLLSSFFRPDFINSPYCFDAQMQKALARHSQGTACVVPVIMRPTRWQGAPFGRLRALPEGAKPVALWQNSDDAFLSITEGIRAIMQAQTTTVQDAAIPIPVDSRMQSPLWEPAAEKRSSSASGGMLAFRKGKQALWDGNYNFAKKELCQTIEEIDKEIVVKRLPKTGTDQKTAGASYLETGSSDYCDPASFRIAEA